VFGRAGIMAVVGTALAVLPAPARAQDYAPINTPGTALTVTAAEVEKALLCSPGLVSAAKTPVLLIQGTGATAKDNWSWTYEPALDKIGVPWCAVDLPDQATGDVQRNGEYVVHALRLMSSRSRRKVSIIGHSQGGMVGRWALRWWPDTRALVDDLIGFAPSNHGTTAADCSASSPCGAAGWQQSDESQFIKALNSRQETFAGISYTSIYTHTDEVVQPNMDAATGSSSLRTGDGARTNVATQDICPAATYEHLLIGLIDPVAYALAIDALTHDGPADPARIAVTVCAEVFHPSIDPVTGPIDGAAAAASYGSYQTAEVPAEPALACYVHGTCPDQVASGSGGALGGIRPAKLVKPSCQSRRVFAVRLPALRGAKATLAGRPLKLKRGRTGRLTATIDLRKRRKQMVTLRVRGTDSRGRRVIVVRRYRTCT